MLKSDLFLIQCSFTAFIKYINSTTNCQSHRYKFIDHTHVLLFAYTIYTIHGIQSIRMTKHSQAYVKVDNERKKSHVEKPFKFYNLIIKCITRLAKTILLEIFVCFLFHFFFMCLIYFNTSSVMVPLCAESSFIAVVVVF